VSIFEDQIDRMTPLLARDTAFADMALLTGSRAFTAVQMPVLFDVQGSLAHPV
jgi:hypothetical protein